MTAIRRTGALLLAAWRDIEFAPTRPELLAGDWLIGRLEARLELHSPVPREVALSLNDVPWKASTSGHLTVDVVRGKAIPPRAWL